MKTMRIYTLVERGLFSMVNIPTNSVHFRSTNQVKLMYSTCSDSFNTQQISVDRETRKPLFLQLLKVLVAF